ncbi:hypothetical protein [Petroclostridium xylanilyticum]|uniref:hypothetical protein n=1 Tax=Petroclostridium xylanilyticum TaxID=1792311 RepID=UPI000B990993|nr:hypothetical protein [Petroclostridium xylanilyticum]
MADDFSKKMEQFKSLLENENMAENIKMFMNMLANSSQNDNKNPSGDSSTENNYGKTPVKEMPPLGAPASKVSMDDTMDTIIKIKRIYDRVTSTDDPRINLLLALKPYLNPKRKAKLDTAVKVVNLTRLSSVFNEIDKW